MPFSYSVANLKDEVEAILHGTTLDSVSNIFGTINRAARTLQEEVDFFELKKKTQIANAIYDSVNDYTAPTDLKMDKIIDLFPQVNRNGSDNFSQSYSEQFGLKKDNNSFTVEYQNGVKVLRIQKNLTTPIVLNTLDSITTNGTWAVGGDGSNLTVDTLNYVSGSASLNFDLTGVGTTAYIENSTMTAVDLSEHEDISALFYWVYLPSASAITSIDLRWGDDSSNYWNATSTTQHFGAFQDGWNLIKAEWDGATETGSPDSSAVVYARITITYDGTADTDIRIDNITSNLGSIYDLKYYSNYMFETSAGVDIEQTTADEDIINLEPVSINGLVLKVAEYAAQQVQEQGGSIDVGYFAGEYQKWLSKYKRSYKSEAIKPSVQYYTPFRR